MALLVLFLLAIALSLLAASLQIRMRLAREDAESVILGGLSDAAVAESLANLAQSSYYSGSPLHAFGDGKIGSEVTPVSPGVYKVLATATYASRKRVVQATVLRSPGHARVQQWRRVTG
jgi:hypothetical protein